MNLIYSLIFTGSISLFFTSRIKKQPYIYYCLAGIISMATSVYEILRITSNLKLQGFILHVEKASIEGLIAISFFTLVMYAGALNPKFTLTRNLIKIRAELAIIGSILLLPHGIVYLIRFFVLKLPKIVASGKFPLLYISYLIIGVTAFAIMIPLFITSFKTIKRKMTSAKWKKLQRTAYIFYFLAYVHIVLVLFNGKKLDVLKLIIYTIIFGGYAILRILKYKNIKGIRH